MKKIDTTVIKINISPLYRRESIIGSALVISISNMDGTKSSVPTISSYADPQECLEKTRAYLSKHYKGEINKYHTTLFLDINKFDDELYALLNLNISQAADVLAGLLLEEVR